MRSTQAAHRRAPNWTRRALRHRKHGQCDCIEARAYRYTPSGVHRMSPRPPPPYREAGKAPPPVPGMCMSLPLRDHPPPDHQTSQTPSAYTIFNVGRAPGRVYKVEGAGRGCPPPPILFPLPPFFPKPGGVPYPPPPTGHGPWGSTGRPRATGATIIHRRCARAGQERSVRWPWDPWREGPSRGGTIPPRRRWGVPGAVTSEVLRPPALGASGGGPWASTGTNGGRYLRGERVPCMAAMETPYGGY